MTAGQWLTAGAHIDSPDGRYTAIMQSDGNLVVYGPSGAIWASRTQASGAALAMQRDGNLVIYVGGRAIWNTQTQGANASLTMQSDGNLVVYSGGRALWSSYGGPTGAAGDTLPAGQSMGGGQQLTSPGGRYAGVMQSDGNLVVYGPSGAIWASRTQASGASLAMQRDGNLVIYAAGRAIWNIQSQGSGAFLRMQDDGNLVVYSGGGALWSAYGGPVGGGGGASGSTQAETAAINWARPYADSHDTTYNGLCLTFVFRAYAAANVNLRSFVDGTIDGSTYPVDIWGPRLHGTTGTGTPPYGALIFWKAANGDRTMSHVALSLGNGNVLSTESGSTPYTHYDTMASHSGAIYLGWWQPA